MADEPGRYVDSYEDVSTFALGAEREATLLASQTECCFMWTTSGGDPVGVIMNFVHHDGRFWVTCTRRRKRVAAVEARPRVAIAISSRGTDIGISQAVTYQGTAVVHDDDSTRAWMYRLSPRRSARPTARSRMRSSPISTARGRVVIEVVPDTRIGFDSEAMFANSPAGPTTTRVTKR
jgi:hypothetical protein